MRIGIDIRNIGKKRTGDEVVFLNLVREFARLDSEDEFELFIDTRSDEDIRVIGDRLGISEKSNFRFTMLPARNKFDWNAWHVPRYLRTHAIDIYHTQYIAPFFVPKRTAIAIHIHDVSFRAEPEAIAPIDRFFLNALIPTSLRKARLVVAPSVFTKEEILRFYRIPKEKILVAWNAVAPEFFDAKDDEMTRETIREKYRLPKAFILSVGTLQPRKNLPRLIEAFSLLSAEDSELGLVLVGNRAGHHIDPEIDRTIRRLNLESRVFFPGFVEGEDLPVLMNMARVFVFPSRYEGFGIPLLEAMSRGVPTVASDIPALREAGGEAAIFAPPNDSTALADAIRRAARSGDERDRLVERGSERARYFSWQKSARDILAAYRKICFYEKT